MNAPETLDTRTSDGLHIAYQVVGSGLRSGVCQQTVPTNLWCW